MPWIKIDDHFDENPKFLRAGPVPTFLWMRCLAYCNRNLTDGFIPKVIATERAWSTSGADWEDPVRSLIEAGLWEEVAGGYQMHDYLEYQPSRAQVLAEREATRKRVSSFRHRNAVTNADNNGACTPLPVPGPVPVPVVPVPEPEKRKTVRAPRAPLPRPTLDEVKAYCLERRNGVEAQVWYDHYTSNGWKVGRNAMKDWKAAVRTWERNGFRQPAARRRGVTAADMSAFADKLQEEGK